MIKKWKTISHYFLWALIKRPCLLELFFFCISEEDAEMLNGKYYINTTKKKRNVQYPVWQFYRISYDEAIYSYLQSFESKMNTFVSGNENFRRKWRRWVAVKVAASARHSEGETIKCIHTHVLQSSSSRQSSSRQSNVLITRRKSFGSRHLKMWARHGEY